MPTFLLSMLQKAKNKVNRTYQSGFSYLCKDYKRNTSLLALCLSLFLVGSCNESAGLFDFSKERSDLQQLTKSELVRHAYALQVAILQSPENITKMEAQDIKLALSAPDFERQDGYNNLWQYRGQGCVLDIYWQKRKGDTPISHVEFRQRRSVLDGTQAVVDPVKWQCVQSIIQDRRDDIREGFSDLYADLSLKAHKL